MFTKKHLDTSFENFFRDLVIVRNKVQTIAQYAEHTTDVVYPSSNDDDDDTTFECWFDTSDINKRIIELLQDLTSFDVVLIEEFDANELEWIQRWKIKLPFYPHVDWIMTTSIYESNYTSVIFSFVSLRCDIENTWIHIQLDGLVMSVENNSTTKEEDAFARSIIAEITATIEKIKDKKIQKEKLNKKLIKSIVKRDINSFKRLIESGADVDDVDIHEPLSCAIHIENVDMCRFLIQAGADIHKKDRQKRTLLHKMVDSKFHEGVKLLLEYDVNVNAQDNHGDTPFLLALFHDRIDIGITLIQAGADITIRDNTGMSPLSLIEKPQRRFLRQIASLYKNK
ncbi:ankyrin repeat PH and SEC7 domain containing protein [Paramecium bursaria Chlorella virus KS1B]|nr:ankyrin repeat PH and SEC7 domain containing protein [Paramecium bursaria Chlorella virus KS1B]